MKKKICVTKLICPTGLYVGLTERKCISEEILKEQMNNVLNTIENTITHMEIYYRNWI